MLKKCVILGLALMVVGGLAFTWVRRQARSSQADADVPVATDSLGSDDYLAKYGRWYLLTPEEQNQLVLELDKDRQNKTDEQLAAEQQARLRADLDRLAAGQMNAGDITDLLYGPNWQAEVEEHRKRKEQEQIAQTTSVVCLAIGSTLVGGSFLIWILWSIGRGLKAWKQRRIERRERREAENTELTDISDDDEVSGDDGREYSAYDEEKADTPEIAVDQPGEPVGVGSAATDAAEDGEAERFLVPRRHPEASGGRRTLATESPNDEGPVAVLLSDEPPTDTEWSPETEWSTQGRESSSESPQPRQRFTPRPKVMVLGEDEFPFTEITTDVEEATGEAESPLKEQAEDLQRQIAEFRQMAQTVQQAKQEQGSPVGDTLKELAQQVSAIREYAASQQNRVEKLQDGYDWTIIRTFCLRVIRCIDNLENRIGRLAEGKNETGQLEEVKDELLFALESSGIEQFRPEIHSDYRGQEKLAEAVKERESTKKAEEIGKIAKVVRPGYRYIIDEESCKIVRTAQVKLFG